MRIKFTGYMNVSDLEGGEHDPDSPTGLTEEAYLDLVNNEEGGVLSLTDLKDVEAVLVS